MIFDWLEREIEDQDRNVEEIEEEEKEIEKREESIKNAIKELGEDSDIQAMLKGNMENVQQDLEINRERKEEIKENLLDLESQINEAFEALSEKRDMLTMLESVGEDVSESLGIIEEREKQLLDSDEKLRQLAQRLGIELDVRKDGADSYLSQSLSDSAETYDPKREADLKLIRGFSVAADLYTGEHYGNLPATKQIWVTDEYGCKVFNSPEETGKKLDSRQGKVKDFLGTCGLVSIVNVLRLAGYPATEEEIVEYARKTRSWFLGRKLCITRSSPDDNGGTSAKNRQMILEHYGISSTLEEATVDNIAKAVSEGRGVIISVFPDMLYYGRPYDSGTHAITVTSVKKDRYGEVIGFYVCDSGSPSGNDNARFVTRFQVENGLTGRPMNVTSIIR